MRTDSRLARQERTLATLPAQRKPCSSKTVERDESRRVRLLPATATGAKAGDENAGAADEGEDDGGIFRRIGAAGLRTQGKCGEKQNRKAKGKECSFQVHGFLKFISYRHSDSYVVLPGCQSGESMRPAAHSRPVHGRVIAGVRALQVCGNGSHHRSRDADELDDVVARSAVVVCHPEIS
jgi:hypothetical protein